MNDDLRVYQEAHAAAIRAGLVETAAAVREIVKGLRVKAVERKGNVIFLRGLPGHK